MTDDASAAQTGQHVAVAPPPEGSCLVVTADMIGRRPAKPDLAGYEPPEDTIATPTGKAESTTVQLYPEDKGKLERLCEFFWHSEGIRISKAAANRALISRFNECDPEVVRGVLAQLKRAAKEDPRRHCPENDPRRRPRSTAVRQQIASTRARTLLDGKRRKGKGKSARTTRAS